MQSKLFIALSLFVVAAVGKPVASKGGSTSAATSTASAHPPTSTAPTDTTSQAPVPPTVKTPPATTSVGSPTTPTATGAGMYSVSPHATPQQAIPCPGGCTWPALDVPPSPLPEWVAAVDLTKIPAAPVVRIDAGGNPINPGYSAGNDQYCSWSYTQCCRPDDICSCPKGTWGLTYDDGPQPPSPALYNFLASQNQRSSNFIIGSRALEYSDALKQAYTQGLQIAIHTWSHPYLTTQTNEQIIAEIGWTMKVIKAITGVTPRYMRPPHGDIDDRVRAIMQQMGLKVVMWNFDTNDWMINPNNLATFQPQWIDRNFTQWAQTINTNTGGLSLEHELSDESVYEAIKSYAILKVAGWNIMPAADCVGDPYYYVEQVNGSVPLISGAPSPTAVPSITGNAASGTTSIAGAATSVTSSAISRSATLGATLAALTFVFAILSL